tara:strand:- start:812 stop:1528 length:717 start_codon:yes stop_codon:yes gene_type:complete
MVIKKIFENEIDEEVHSAFLKFSRGEFKNRYLIEIKKQKDKWAIKTSAEFANFLVKKCLEKAGNEKIPIKGIIVSTLNLEDDELGFEIKKRSNFQGIRKLQVDTEIYPRKILDLMEKYPRVFFALTFFIADCQLKIKPKAPKSGKPGKKDEEGPKADFCSLKTKDNEIIRDLLFDVDLGSISEVKANHIIKIEGIVYPEDMDNLKPEEIREKSKRKGIVIRKLIINGKEKISEYEFVA